MYLEREQGRRPTSEHIEHASVDERCPRRLTHRARAAQASHSRAGAVKPRRHDALRGTDQTSHDGGRRCRPKHADASISRKKQALVIASGSTAEATEALQKQVEASRSKKQAEARSKQKHAATRRSKE